MCEVTPQQLRNLYTEIGNHRSKLLHVKNDIEETLEKLTAYLRSFDATVTRMEVEQQAKATVAKVEGRDK